MLRMFSQPDNLLGIKTIDIYYLLAWNNLLHTYNLYNPYVDSTNQSISTVTCFKNMIVVFTYRNCIMYKR